MDVLFLHSETKVNEYTLSEVSKTFGRGTSRHRPRGDPKLVGGKYPLIQTGDIANARHRITTYTQTYNELGLSQSKLWPRSTVCIAIVGANVAESAILDFEACFPDSVIGIIVDVKRTTPDYVQYLLSVCRLQLKQEGKGTARDNINIGTFAGRKFPFPTLHAQNEIVLRANRLHESIASVEELYDKKLSALEELKQSLLHQAFTGQL